MRWLVVAALPVLGGPVWAQDEGLGVPVIATVVWPGADLSRAVVKVFRDAQWRELLDEVPAAEQGGLAVLMLPPGTYYLMAVVDANGNNQLDAGDGLGFYGVTDLADPGQRPQAYEVRAGAGGDAGPTIHIVAVRDENGRLRPVGGTPPGSTPADPASAPAPPEGGPQPPPAGTRVGGQVTRPGAPSCPLFVLLMGTEEGGEPVAGRVALDGSFTLHCAPGTYRLYVVGDANADRRLDAGDPVGMYGVPDWSQVTEPLPVLTLAAASGVEGVRLAVNGVVSEGGGVLPWGATGAAAAGGLKLPLGEFPALLAGRVTIPEGTVAAATVLVFRDVNLTQLIARAACDGEGGYAIALPAGTCYLLAALDTGPDGRIGPGDVIGFYGADPADPDAAPPPVTLGPGGLRSDLDVAPSMAIGASEPPEAAGGEAPWPEAG